MTRAELVSLMAAILEAGDRASDRDLTELLEPYQYAERAADLAFAVDHLAPSPDGALRLGYHTPPEPAGG
jgi:hypothetical protein